MKNYIQPGDMIDVTVTSASVSSGQPVLVGSLFGIVSRDALLNETVAIGVTGVYEIAKDDALAISAGDRVFWDAANQWVDKTSTAQTCVGIAVESKLAADTTVRVLLGGSTPAGT